MRHLKKSKIFSPKEPHENVSSGLAVALDGPASDITVTKTPFWESDDAVHWRYVWRDDLMITAVLAV